MRALFVFLGVLLFIGCKKTTNQHTKQSNYSLKIAYNVLFDDENDDYEVFSMNLDGSNKQNITNLKGVEWTYYGHKDNIYFVSDKDTLRRHYFLYKMKANGSNKTKISNIRLTDSWHSSRYNGSQLIVRPHKSVDTAFYIIDTLGNVLKRLKPNLAYLSDPLFSPNGEQIVFRGDLKAFKKDNGYLDELYIMNADGSNLRQLTQYPKSDTTSNWYNYHAGPPRWHPTKNFISYGSFQNGKYSLFAVTPDGKKQWQLLPKKSSSTVWHDWSPDGKWLVYDFSINRKAPYHIELMNWETKETTVLTDSTYQYHQSPVFVKAYN